MADITTLFIDSLTRAGIPPETAIIGDGRLRRYRVAGDTRGRLNGWYRLTIEGNIAFGAFGSWKHRVNEKWYSKRFEEYTPADQEKIRARRQEIKLQEALAQKKAAEKSLRLWRYALPAHNNEYAARKKITPIGARQLSDKLIVPLYYDDGAGLSIHGLQFILPDGTKRFLTGSRKKGCYASISQKDDSREIIYICEGYATGASIYEAVKCPVVVAFDAGNLKPVAEIIRAKYSNAQIIIAGDNDAFTEGNPGVRCARSASEAVKGRAVWPVFAAENPDKFTDFNDLYVSQGTDAMRAALLGEIKAPKPVPVVNVKNMDAWKNYLIEGKEMVVGFPFPYEAKSKLNAYMFLKHSDYLGEILTYNEFSDEIILIKCPPWESPKKFMPRAIVSEDFFMIAAHLERMQIKIGQEVAASAAIKVAKETSINPPRDYFDSLVWDGRHRLDRWLTYYLGAEESQPEEYLRLVGSKWLIGAVSRIYSPGCKFDSVLILEGEQNVGKSTALRLLATFNGEDYFLDSMGDISNKDTLMTMQGKIIIEMAELASFKKSENEEIKGFISRQVDEYRPPYARTVIKRPRYYVLGASTNEIQDGYLTDTTGNRRYWPVKCTSIDLEALEADKQQLWAEAVFRYKQGERTWLTREESTYSTAQQKKRQIEDAWMENIQTILIGEFSTDVNKICNGLLLKPKDINNITKRRIKSSLEMLGWYETRKHGSRIWRRHGFAEENEENENNSEKEQLSLVTIL